MGLPITYGPDDIHKLKTAENRWRMLEVEYEDLKEELQVLGNNAGFAEYVQSRS